MAASAQAADALRSNYAQFKGEAFFLLADNSFGTTENALVRLEVPSGNMGQGYLEQYSGVDIMVYRIPDPLQFLSTQKDLHRIQLKGNYKGEGLANTLGYLWDSWYRNSRRAWQRVFSTDARRAVTAEAPELKTASKINRLPTFRNNPQFAPLPGYDLVERFRYPLWQAKPIEAPKDVVLDGSSSEFIATKQGNVMVPIGKRAPGLYLVEAIIGSHRATTLVFVSNTVAVTKIATGQMLVWAAQRSNGAPVADVKVLWTDGTGLLKSGKTAANGVSTLDRAASPEHTYVLGQDPQGGVFVSENFYYDSEIYDTKLYAVTDRPLYRPGDEVNAKLIGRKFTSARKSELAAQGEVKLTVIDPNGTPLLMQKLNYLPASGADTRFRLPDNTIAGGYELRLDYQGTQYAAAFRVAEYVKPHFEIGLLPDKRDFKTGDPVSGKIQLSYPDGKPVRDARVELTARGQRISMVEGELQYAGPFPLTIEQTSLVTDSQGKASFTLPPAKEPSRYILTVFANDGAAYRVKTTKEVLIERGDSLYTLRAPRQFTQPGENVKFAINAAGTGNTKPTNWEIVHLESQRKTSGKLDSAAKEWNVKFPTSGSYTLALKDEHGNLLGAASHWVAGPGIKVAAGNIEILFNKETYKPGETAEALITFPEEVSNALLTLERDTVESIGLLDTKQAWVQASKAGPTQWVARIPVRNEHGPNITFSVAYVKHGDYVFQNRGMQVEQPQIQFDFKADKMVYLPGEKVSLEVNSTLDGKPVSADVMLSVVDEMIYVLQPETAPNIFDFFYHPRRNNVRTTSSLSFISYDLAVSQLAGPPPRSSYNERGVKVLERPRRDNVDTAFWAPNLKTDASGHAVVSFIMPDSLTRWRITARAMTANGIVGQKTSYVRSDKPFYAKWTSPVWMREGDNAVASVAVFNQGEREQGADIQFTAGQQTSTNKVTLKRGANYFPLKLAKLDSGTAVSVQVRSQGKVVDSLETPIKTIPLQWRSPRVQAVNMAQDTVPLSLPADAANVRLTLADSSAAHFTRIADDLIEYPFGCVEQTASRLIPLSIGVQALQSGPANAPDRLTQLLQHQRLRLVHMAGPDAIFSWWGAYTDTSALITGYAYYADWYASRTLGLSLPAEHWQRVLDVYQKQGFQEPLLHRALILWWANEMGLPVKTLVTGLQEDAGALSTRAEPTSQPVTTSTVLANPEGAEGRAMMLALLGSLSSRNKLELSPALAAQIQAAQRQLQASSSPLSQALYLMVTNGNKLQAEQVLSTVRADMPTMDRSLTLVWIQKTLGGTPQGRLSDITLQAPWREETSALGAHYWRLADGQKPPASLTISKKKPGSAPITAMVQYESVSVEKHLLPVNIERKFYRLHPGDKALAFTAEALDDKAKLHTDELYVDEITLTPESLQRFGLLEVPLPPGGAVESSTWGLQISGLSNDQPQALEKARHEPMASGYSIALDPLEGSAVVRHLVRFSQKGKYVLPPSRFYRMYQPEQKAFEDKGRVQRVMEVE